MTRINKCEYVLVSIVANERGARVVRLQLTYANEPICSRCECICVTRLHLQTNVHCALWSIVDCTRVRAKQKFDTFASLLLLVVFVPKNWFWFEPRLIFSPDNLQRTLSFFHFCSSENKNSVTFEPPGIKLLKRLALQPKLSGALEINPTCSWHLRIDERPNSKYLHGQHLKLCAPDGQMWFIRHRNQREPKSCTR
jgi:hypothetical protein